VATPNLKDDLASLRIDSAARGGGSRRGTWIVLGVVVAALAAGGWLWSRRLEAADVKTTTVTAQTGGGAAPGAVLNASGYVTARRRATVSSKVTGKVLEVYVEEGTAVRRGQVLARLDDSQIRASLAVAQAQLASARKAAAEDQARLREAQLNLDRRRQLLKEKVIGRAELDESEAQVESLTARIELADQQVKVATTQIEAIQIDLADMVVRAPFNGIAISKDAQPGEMISPVSAGGGFTRTGICTIVDMTSLEIEVDVSESYINRVRPGQPVEAVLDAYPDWRIPAHVITTVPSADRQKATVRVRIGFDEEPASERAGGAAGAKPLGTERTPVSPRERSGDPGVPASERVGGSAGAKPPGYEFDPRILPDMGVKVSFLSDRAAPAAADAPPRARLLVPKNAVRTQNGASVLFVVQGDRVERRAVKLGVEDRGQIEVVSGINAGERVVVEGPPTLDDGARVKER
jgi:RND family efflux transporter MFP subunit